MNNSETKSNKTTTYIIIFIIIFSYYMCSFYSSIGGILMYINRTSTTTSTTNTPTTNLVTQGPITNAPIRIKTSTEYNINAENAVANYEIYKYFKVYFEANTYLQEKCNSNLDFQSDWTMFYPAYLDDEPHDKNSHTVSFSILTTRDDINSSNKPSTYINSNNTYAIKAFNDHKAEGESKPFWDPTTLYLMSCSYFDQPFFVGTSSTTPSNFTSLSINGLKAFQWKINVETNTTFSVQKPSNSIDHQNKYLCNNNGSNMFEYGEYADRIIFTIVT